MNDLGLGAYLIRDTMTYENHVVQVGTLGGSLNDPRNPMYLIIRGGACNESEWIKSADWKSFAQQKIDAAYEEAFRNTSPALCKATGCGSFDPPEYGEVPDYCPKHDESFTSSNLDDYK